MSAKVAIAQIQLQQVNALSLIELSGENLKIF